MLSNLTLQVDVERDVRLGGVVMVGVVIGGRVGVIVAFSVEFDVTVVAIGVGH